MKKLIYAFSIQFIVLFLAFIVPLASAQTFEVSRTDDPVPDGCNSGTDCSLREAIIAANDVGSGTATIQLEGGEIYTLSIVNPTPEDDFDSPDETTGSLKILNTDATVRIEATGTGMATINADDIDRVFFIYPGTDVEMDELEITGGNPVNGLGGGMYVINNTNLEITNSSITGNVAISISSGLGYGGGIRGAGATITIRESTISDNEAGFQGGGLDLGDFEGGLSDITIENSIISNNFSGSYGGGIDTDDTDLVIIESSISGNRGEDNGGGLYIWGGSVTINRSAIINNSARDESNQGGFGGGLNANGGNILILNSTISGNETGNGANSGTAGGIYVTNFSDALIDIVNSTITDNTGWSIGGIYNGTGTINVSNSIIANQAAGKDCSGTINSNGYNIESDDTCDFTETGDFQNIDPLLGPLQDNGGPVLTQTLLTDPFSPAINNGSNALYTSEGGGDLANDSDANGNDRVFEFGSGGIIDIGAFELQQNAGIVGCPATSDVLYVKKGENGSGANWFDAIGELRDALALYEDETCTIEDADEIWVAAGTYTPTDDSGDREATFNIFSELDILGGFVGTETNKNNRNWESNITILSGDINNDDDLSGNSYHVVTATNGGFSGLLDGFKITGGNANGSDPYDRGGGLYASNGSVASNNIIFENNYAESAGGGAYVIETENRIGAQHPRFFRVTFRNNESGEDGGGLALENAESRISSLSFENNEADRYGGGIFMNESAPVIKNVFFTNNYANSQGGGMANDRSAPELYNIEFNENTARINGGAIDNAFQASEGTFTLYNVTIYGNEAELSNGGGIYNRNGAVLDIHNSIIWGNTAGGTGNQIWNASISSAELFYSSYGNEEGDIVEGGGFTATNSLTINPLFEDAPGGDLTLTSLSPAINTGDPATDLSDFRVITSDAMDLAENPRIYNGDADIIDMGAYEFQGEPSEEPAFAPFITTWEVDAGDLQITIPTAAGQTYSYDIDWGDGESDTGQTSDASHTYDSADTYTVKISGTFPQIEFFNADDRDKILSVEQWGDIGWASMRKAFQGATNLEINASDEPDLSNATSMLEMFAGATSVNTGLENWNVSTITSMFGLFDGATSFNGDISGWTVSAVTDMIRMFAGATSFNRDISRWVVDNVSVMESMFDGATAFNQDLSDWNTGNVEGMSWMFNGATAFNQDLGDWNITNVTSMTEMLDGSGLSTENYDATLTGWAAQTVQSEVELGAGGLTYCGAEADRQSLIDDDSWDITGDALAEGCEDPIVLDAPTLSSPSDEATGVERPVTLTWNSVDDATSYDVQIVMESSSFDSPFFDEESADTDIEVPGLDPSTEYKWRIRVGAGENESEWSETWAFTTNADEEELVAPQLTSPSDETTDINLTLNLDWDAAGGAESYRVQLVEESGSFDTPDFDDETTDTEIEVNGLSPAVEYKWRVRSLTSDDESEWSELWTFTTRALPEGEDQRILASNSGDFEFSGKDFGVSNAGFSIIIESLPDEGSLNYDGDAVEADDDISIADINSGMMTWSPPSDEYGYNFTSFEFIIVDDSNVESEEPHTLTINLGTVFAELSGSEGWRFMSNPSDGDSYFDLFSEITVETGPPPSQTLYELDQTTYEWDPVGSTGDEPGMGTPFIIYVLQDDLPTMVESGDNWEALDGSYSYPGLDYDAAGDGLNPDDFYLLGNPHPIALDFCEFTDENMATSVYFWNPEANDGNGDYINLSCEAPEDVHIAPFQAFWIRTTGTNPSLDIPEEAYLEGTTVGYFKEKSEQDEQFLITLNVTGEERLFMNRAQILFTEEATEDLDRFDAPKLSAEGLAQQWLSFHSMDDNGRAYAFQSLPASHLTDDKVRIPLDIQTTESGQFTMDWTLPEAHIFSGNYYLKDNETGEVMELREGSSYRFEIDPTQTSKVMETLEVLAKERSVRSPKDFVDLGKASPRFELLIATSGIDGLSELGAVPEDFTLAQNYPNPFNPTTVINYQLPITSQVRLEVYDMLGRNVATLVNGQVSAGRHTINFDARNLSSGVYLYRLVAGSQIMTKKLTILK